MNLKKKVLKNDEDHLIYEDMASDDEWFVDNKVDIIPYELWEKYLNVNIIDGDKIEHLHPPQSNHGKN